MKMTPAMKKAQENMAPGILTATGFLGTDTRPISDIIEQDEEHMRKLGLDFDNVAEKLTYLAEQGKKGLGEPITIDNTWQVQVDDTRGRLACPFEDGIYRKVSIQVHHIASGINFCYSELSIHMMEKHHFLQGKGSPFRLDPETLKMVLE